MWKLACCTGWRGVLPDYCAVTSWQHSSWRWAKSLHQLKICARRCRSWNSSSKTSEPCKLSNMFLGLRKDSLHGTLSRSLPRHSMLLLLYYGFQFYSSRQNQSQTSQDGIRKQSQNPNLSPQAIKHLWIRTALTEKVLDKIVLYLVENSRLRICSTHSQLHIRIIVLHCLDVWFCLVAVNSMREKPCWGILWMDQSLRRYWVSSRLLFSQAYYGQQGAFSWMGR